MRLRCDRELPPRWESLYASPAHAYIAKSAKYETQLVAYIPDVLPEDVDRLSHAVFAFRARARKMDRSGIGCTAILLTLPKRRWISEGV